MNLFLKMKGAAKKKIMRACRIDEPYSFKYAAAITQQLMTFQYKNKNFEIAADGSTPLYETVSEIIDYDCYQKV